VTVNHSTPGGEVAHVDPYFTVSARLPAAAQLCHDRHTSQGR
jgi:hypothetical protein